jgi:hypothetical protein
VYVSAVSKVQISRAEGQDAKGLFILEDAGKGFFFARAEQCGMHGQGVAAAHDFVAPIIFVVIICLAIPAGFW